MDSLPYLPLLFQSPPCSVLKASALGGTHLWINAWRWSQHALLMCFSSGVSEGQGGSWGCPKWARGWPEVPQLCSEPPTSFPIPEAFNEAPAPGCLAPSDLPASMPLKLPSPKDHLSLQFA